VLVLVWALAMAAMLLGVASLTPADADMDSDNVFASTLILLVPLLLAGGFPWDDASAKHLRATLWGGAVGCLVLAIVPLPSLIAQFGHGHAVLLALLAVSAGAATRLVGSRSVLMSWLDVSGE
jgi:hypothetical protein